MPQHLILKERHRRLVAAVALTMLLSTAAPMLYAAECPAPSRRQIDSAILDHRVLPCMTKAQVLRAAGKYDEYDVCQGGIIQVWYFPRRIVPFPALIEFNAAGQVTRFANADCGAVSFGSGR